MAHRIAFVLASTDHGTMIVNRLDQQTVKTPEGVGAFGVGFSLLTDGKYELDNVLLLMKLLNWRREGMPPERQMIALDCGANMGTYTLSMARHMDGWGQVVAVEPQNRIFQALCGSIVINNLFNAWPVNAALGAEQGTIGVPVLNYQEPASYGSMELVQADHNEPIGQPVDYTNFVSTPVCTIDTMGLPRLDLLKIDAEGMEYDVLLGGKEMILRHNPIIMAEWTKSDRVKLSGLMDELHYRYFQRGMNMFAIHKKDPVLLQWIEAANEGRL
jgi:FkbM family methyltransferase